jgi:23S rRNA (guanosine2251-2'-O)-methyltransferase
VVKKKVGTGGNNKRRLAGKGPTPKAEDRTYHPAAKRKKAAAKKGKPAKAGTKRPGTRDSRRSTEQSGVGDGARSKSVARTPRSANRETPLEEDIIVGRNPVLEALRAEMPSRKVLMARGIDIDDRVREIVELAREKKIPIEECARRELDAYPAHQGIALRISPYVYKEFDDVRGKVEGVPLFVALDGVTDPRNLGAIVRSACAFGAHGVVVPERRSAGMSAVAWKASAGAAARTPVTQIRNLVATIQEVQKEGYFVIGLDADGEALIGELAAATEPLLLIVGGEGKGLSRLVREHCDLVVSIPMSSEMESLNASIAAAIALFSISEKRKALK